MHIMDITLLILISFHPQVIRMMTDKCRNQEAMIAEFEMREQEYQELETEADILRQQVHATR